MSPSDRKRAQREACKIAQWYPWLSFLEREGVPLRDALHTARSNCQTEHMRASRVDWIAERARALSSLGSGPSRARLLVLIDTSRTAIGGQMRARVWSACRGEDRPRTPAPMSLEVHRGEVRVPLGAAADGGLLAERALAWREAKVDDNDGGGAR